MYHISLPQWRLFGDPTTPLHGSIFIAHALVDLAASNFRFGQAKPIFVSGTQLVCVVPS